MSNALIKTDFSFPGQVSLYKGKVRDVYNINNDFLVMVASDRISAFDVVLPKGIPYKGQVLNQIAEKFLDATSDIVPNWKIASPDPNVTVGHLCEPYKVEMVIRGYLTGHAAREYKLGKRLICGVPMPEGMIENQKFPNRLLHPQPKLPKATMKIFGAKKLLNRNWLTKPNTKFWKITPGNCFSAAPKWQQKRD